MSAPPRRTGRRRAHAAASSRIFTAGLSSAAAFGMMAGMAVTAGAGADGEPGEVALLPAGPASAPSSIPAPAPREIVVVRRHWIPVPSGPATPARGAGLPVTATPPPASAPTRAVSAPPPVTRRPVTRSRGS